LCGSVPVRPTRTGKLACGAPVAPTCVWSIVSCFRYAQFVSYQLWALTVNALLVPLDPFVAVSVKLPVFEIVTLCEASTPAVNAAVVTGAASGPAVDVSAAVRVDAATALL